MNIIAKTEEGVWLVRKLWNENTVEIRRGYWFTLNPILDLQVGKASKVKSLLVNTRGINFRGGLGNKSIFRPQF
jgi:hypothetical protein